MTVSLADPIAAVLTGHGTGERDAAEIGKWIQGMIEDARRGWVHPDFHRAGIVEGLRTVCGRETRAALAALDCIERAVFGGVRVPATGVRERFIPTKLSLWDRELNCHLCPACESWTEPDSHVELLGPLWCPCGALLVP